MYEKVSTKLNFVDREQKVLDFWKENQVFEKSVEETSRQICLNTETNDLMQ